MTASDADAPRASYEAVRTAVRRLWEQAWSAGDADVAGASFEEAQRALDALIADPSGLADPTLEDRIAEDLDALEEDARSLFRDTTLAPEIIGRGLAVLRARSRIMLRLTRARSGRLPRDEIPFLLAELKDIDVGLGDDAPEDPDEAAVDPAGPIAVAGAADAQVQVQVQVEETQRDVSRLRVEVLCLGAERLLEQTGAAELSRGVIELFELSRALEHVRKRLELHRDDVGAADRALLDRLIASVRSEKDRLTASLLIQVSQVRTREDFEPVLDAARALTGELDEARVAAFEKASSHTIARLRRLQLDGGCLRDAYRRAWKRVAAESAPPQPTPADPEPRDTFAEEATRAGRRLAWMTGRVRNVASDRTLALRLGRVFGERIVRIWEAFIFWLIMLVLGLIVIDHYRDSVPEEGIPWTVWTDTWICAIFLLDFGVRMTLTPDRLRYFRRHLLTEFLPSLPFGLLEYLENVPEVFRATRLLRLPRVFRIMRVARPFIRIVRLFLFVARAADRLVERNAWVLNRDIVFFSDPVVDEAEPTLLKRARDLDGWVNRTTSRIFAAVGVGAQVISARWRSRFVRTEMAHGAGVPAYRGISRKERVAIPESRVEDVVEQLRDLDETQVADVLGVEFADHLTASLRFFRLPLLRRLPLVRFVLGPSGAPDPLLTTARLGNVLGDALQIIQRVIDWFADLYGTVTGAQVLDRLGAQLIKATARPAKRLILFGAIGGFLLLIVQLSRIGFLDDLAKGFNRVVFYPVLALGLICLIPLFLGVWLRRVAGQAADFYERIAEAQFLALTEIGKEKNSASDLRVLAARVLLPELTLGAGEVDAGVRDALLAQVLSHGVDAASVRSDDGDEVLDWAKCEFMLLFYRDFIDGAFFHANDTKIANMLLGNLTLENIRRNRLSFSRKDVRRLEALDIGRGKGGVTGPYVWFNFITHSVAQHVARLIIEYNQHCIPLAEIESADPVDRKLFDDWLRHRDRISEARRRGVQLRDEEEAQASGAEGTLVYRTTAFNALHFLTVDSARDEAVLRRFGERVFHLLPEDRENLIRDIFGTFPVHDLPKDKRTFNPYELYRAYCARGRIFVFPLVAIWLTIRLLALAIRRIRKVIRDLVDPRSRPSEIATGRSGFDVARRKIHRMRRPVAIQAVRLRAMFDLEYLGLSLPGKKEPGVQVEDLLANDLRSLEASEREWQEFRDLKSRRETQHRRLMRLLRQRLGKGVPLEEALIMRSPHLSGRTGEAVRALATAFACDHRGVHAIVAAVEELRELLAKVRRERGPRRRFHLRIPAVRRRRVAALVTASWPTVVGSGEVDAALEPDFLDAVLRRGPEMERHLVALAEHLPAGADPGSFALETLLSVAEQPSSWTEQIIAVRTVQTLAMIDLAGYERVIAELGQYGAEVGVAEAKARLDDSAALQL